MALFDTVTALLQANGIAPRAAQPPSEDVRSHPDSGKSAAGRQPSSVAQAKVDLGEEEDASTAAILARERVVACEWRIF